MSRHCPRCRAPIAGPHDESCPVPAMIEAGEHFENDSLCWCDPQVEYYAGGRLVIHRYPED